MKQKTVSLVLGSGGAKGLTHIGVIRWLEKNNYKIESISGCSIGALVGGFYAAGKLDAYVSWLEELDLIGMLRLLDFDGSGGLVSGKTLMEKMKDLVGDDKIEDLDIKFTAVATDIVNEKEVWINKGSLLDAIRASISLPMFFTPYEYDDKKLVDGGVLNPVPIAPTFNDNNDITIAVNLGGEASTEELLPKKEEFFIMTKIKEYMSSISLPQSVQETNGVYSVANDSFDTMQGTIARMKLAAYPPDLEISIPKNICNTFEFNRYKELIDYGYMACEKSFKTYKDRIKI